jgi:hypothetical protein
VTFIAASIQNGVAKVARRGAFGKGGPPSEPPFPKVPQSVRNFFSTGKLAGVGRPKFYISRTPSAIPWRRREGP